LLRKAQATKEIDKYLTSKVTFKVLTELKIKLPTFLEKIKILNVK